MTTADPEDDTFEIGYMEDGIFFVTKSRCVPDAEAAASYVGSGWIVVADTVLGPTGRWVNSKDPEWEECSDDTPGARVGWRLVNTSMAQIYDGEWIDNPHYRGD